MKHFEGEYLGAALQSFVRGLSHSGSLIQQILQSHGLTQVAADELYDLNTARSIYHTVGNQIGERSLYTVGLKMIESAEFPPGISDIRSMLSSLDHARFGVRLSCHLVTAQLRIQPRAPSQRQP